MSKWYITFALSLNWNTASYIEIMKQWMPQNSIGNYRKKTGIPCAVKAHKKYFFSIIFRKLRSQI